MYDFGLSVMEQYGLEVKSSYRGRGALICETQQGLKIIREFKGAARKLELMRELQVHIRECSALQADCVMENQEGELVSFDKDGIGYVVRDWFGGRECDPKSRSDVLESVRTLARLHTVMILPMREGCARESLVQECSRHNREIRMVNAYINRKKMKSELERRLQECIGDFLRQGERTVEALKDSGYETLKADSDARGMLCHGDCNQHNVLWTGKGVLLVNYDKVNYDCQVADLYQFMRKVLEKNNWNVKLGRDMILTYHGERPLSWDEVQNLRLRLAYPWKFWKLVNHYANHSKTWISGRSLDKLEVLMRQQKMWFAFMKNCFSDLFFSQFTI